MRGEERLRAVRFTYTENYGGAEQLSQMQGVGNTTASPSARSPWLLKKPYPV